MSNNKYSRLNRSVVMDKLYVIEDVLSIRQTGSGSLEALVKWGGYDSTHDSWEPVENVNHVDEFRKFDTLVEQLKTSSDANAFRKHDKLHTEMNIQAQVPSYLVKVFKERDHNISKFILKLRRQNKEQDILNKYIFELYKNLQCAYRKKTLLLDIEISKSGIDYIPALQLCALANSTKIKN